MTPVQVTLMQAIRDFIIYTTITSCLWAASGIAQAVPQTFGVIGDYGSNSGNELLVANLVKGWNPDIILTVGDNNYGNLGDGGADLGDWDSRIGGYYGDYILQRDDGKYANQTGTTQRFYPAIGNHDTGIGPGPSVGSGGATTGYLDYFHDNPGGTSRLPTGGGVHNVDNTYYDFIEGDIHFFFMDSDHARLSSTSLSDQTVWLLNGLAASTSKFKFVVMHHAPYSSGEHGDDPVLQLPFASLGAHAVFAGHDHNMERLEVDGIPYYVVGSGGQTLRSLPNSLEGSQFTNNTDFGALRMTVDGDIATLDFISANVGNAGTVLDSSTIDLSNLPPPPEIGLRITEIMFDPAGSNEHEYVELYNGTTADIDLSNYKLNGNKLSDGSMISAGGTAVMVRTDSTARPLQNYVDAWGPGINFVELDNGGSGLPPWQGLSNGGSTVEIMDDQSNVVASVTYDNAPPWPGNNDSSSIYLTDAKIAIPEIAAVWALSVAGENGAYAAQAPRVGDVGSPGFVAGLVVEDADFDGDGFITGSDFLAWQIGVGTASPAHADGDANGDGVVNETDLAIWEQQYGTAALAASAAVPEPGSSVLFVVACLMFLESRSRKGDRH